VSHIDEVDDCARCMIDLNYESLGEFGIDGRRYFKKSEPNGRRAFHVHVFEHGSRHVTEHIAFRDYLLAHPRKAREYSDLKARLAANDVASSREYQDSKAPFIEACVRAAIRWSNGQS